MRNIIIGIACIVALPFVASAEQQPERPPPEQQPERPPPEQQPEVPDLNDLSGLDAAIERIKERVRSANEIEREAYFARRRAIARIASKSDPAALIVEDADMQLSVMLASAERREIIALLREVLEELRNR